MQRSRDSEWILLVGDRLNSSGGCVVAVTAKVKIGWVRFRKCEKLLLGNGFPLRTKGKIYCVA